MLVFPETGKLFQRSRNTGGETHNFENLKSCQRERISWQFESRFHRLGMWWWPLLRSCMHIFCHYKRNNFNVITVRSGYSIDTRNQKIWQWWIRGTQKLSSFRENDVNFFSIIKKKLKTEWILFFLTLLLPYALVVEFFALRYAQLLSHFIHFDRSSRFMTRSVIHKLCHVRL